jgi:hypothetical protein
MTPQEKANQLLIKVKDSLTEKANKDDMLWEMTVHYQTIDIVLLMVDEIINIAPDNKSIIGNKYLTIKEFWEQVKKEIENL